LLLLLLLLPPFVGRSVEWGCHDEVVGGGIEDTAPLEYNACKALLGGAGVISDELLTVASSRNGIIVGSVPPVVEALVFPGVRVTLTRNSCPRVAPHCPLL